MFLNHLDSSLQNNDTFKIICALERSIGGDLGGGKSGGVIAIEMFPDTLQIMTWPLSGNDSLIVSELYNDGSIVFTFRHQNVTLIPKSKWDWLTVEDVTTIVGSFRINDELTIMNRGFLSKDNINHI